MRFLGNISVKPENFKRKEKILGKLFDRDCKVHENQWFVKITNCQY